MEFEGTTLEGCYVLHQRPIVDSRGFFSRMFCKLEFEAMGLMGTFVQSNLSYNAKAATLRGMHWQESPFEEVKLVHVVSGSICDIVVDLRRQSRTFGKWERFFLNAESNSAIYVPGGFAHGFLTLSDNTKVFYHMSNFFHSEAARGFRYNDGFFNIEWPVVENLIISEKDLCYPDYEP